MGSSVKPLDELANEAGFQDSSVWTSYASRVIGDNFYYRLQEGHRTIDFITFGTPSDYDSAKLFRKTGGQMVFGVDLNRDLPTYSGMEVVAILNDYIRKAGASGEQKTPVVN